MEEILAKEVPEWFKGASNIFVEKKDELCEMDANMGDGDLGLTMSKGFGALPDLIAENMDENNIGMTLVKAGMKMAAVVPSTMGTLMSSGVMEGGKKLKDKKSIGKQELVDFLEGYVEGIKKRGKCETGERTILDAIHPAYEAAKDALSAEKNLKETMGAAIDGAKKGVEATKEMQPKYGKAVVFAAKAMGIPDQGAMAGLYLLEGLGRYFK
jgi:hypothetical protein